MLRGVYVVVVLWAMLMAGVARMARDRGRSIALWTIAAALAGGAAFALGAAVLEQIIASDDDINEVVLLLSMILPPALLVAAMGGIWVYLYRTPVQVSQGNEWKVHFVNRGDGRIVIANGKVELVWGEGADASWIAPLGELKVEPDGECVRITGPGVELAAMPMGKPDSPEGRRRRSQVLALRLRAK